MPTDYCRFARICAIAPILYLPSLVPQFIRVGFNLSALSTVNTKAKGQTNREAIERRINKDKKYFTKSFELSDSLKKGFAKVALPSTTE